MFKILLLLALVTMGADLNWNGAGDTAQPVVKGTTVAYTKGFPMGTGEQLRLSMLVDDTALAGFASDSVALHWGYQGFTLAWNASGVLDTIYEQVQIVDTLATASYGGIGTISKLGTDNLTPTLTRKISDTLGCAGYASQSRLVQPVYNTYFRFYIAGISAVNRSFSNLKVRCVVTRKNALNVRD